MLTAREQALCTLIAKRELALLDDLKVHVELPTGGRNTPALDESRERLTARAAALGAAIELIPGIPRPDWLYGGGGEKPGQSPLPTAICRRNAPSSGGAAAGSSRRELLIAGHLDTVHDPAGSFRALTINADGKTATGPGCVDMKGGLVIGLAALEALEELGERFPWTLLLNSDEETGSYHSAPAIKAEAARVAAASGLGIALEPATANGGLVTERSGSGQFMIECEGKSAHVGRNFFDGISAVYRLAEVVNLFGQMMAKNKPDGGARSNTLIVNIGPLEGGATTNVVPDRARAWGNVRFESADDWKKFKMTIDYFRSLDDTVVIADDRGLAKVWIQTSQNRPAKPLTPEVQRFAELCRDAAQDLNQQLPFAKTGGVCDGNLMQAAGLPTIDTLGVRGGGLHTPDEWIDLSSLVECCQLLALVMLRAASS